MSPKKITNTKTQVLTLFMMLLGIMSGLVAVKTVRDIRSRAQVISAPIPSPETALTVPSLRLTTNSKAVGFNAVIPVDVYLQTTGAPMVEAHVVVTYDPTLLEFDPKSVQKTTAFSVIQTVSSQLGQIEFTAFSDPHQGQPAFASKNEEKIATFYVKTKTVATSNALLQLEFAKDTIEKTSLVGESVVRTENPVNLLESVEGTSFVISS